MVNVREKGMDESHWTRPPAEDRRLFEYFAEDGMALPSTHSAFVHMASIGFGVRGAPDPDGRMINSGKVGFKQRDPYELLGRNNEDGAKSERPSIAQRYRETANLLAQLEPDVVRVLRLAFGPQDQIPELKLGENAQARRRIDGEDDEASSLARVKARRAYEKRLGSWRQVLVITESASKSHAAAKNGGASLPRWLVTGAKPADISAAQREAYALVREAWNRWADLRGRRKSFRHVGVFVRPSEPSAKEFA